MRFFVLALPRSRTAWLANYLTYADSFCLHEGFWDCGSVEDLADRMSLPHRAVGNSDTFNVVVVDQLRARFPDAKFAVVLRPLAEVHRSLVRIDMPANMSGVNDRLQAAAEWCECVVDYRNLDNEAVHIAKYLTGIDMPAARTKLLTPLTIKRDTYEVTPQFAALLRKSL